MRGFIYWNIHAGLFSVKALDGKHRGRVVAHARAVLLTGVAFKVSEAGRQRVLTTGRKNVHAGLVGDVRAALIETRRVVGLRVPPWNDSALVRANEIRCGAMGYHNGAPVIYNPNDHKSFVTVSACDHRAPIHKAAEALCFVNGITGGPNVFAVWSSDS